MAEQAVESFSMTSPLKSGLQILLRLDDQAFEKLLAIVGDEPASLDADAFARSVQEKFEAQCPGVTDDAYGLVRTVVALRTTRRSFTLSLDDFARAVANSPLGEDTPSTEQRQALQKRLRLLLDLNSIGITSKASDVAHDHERVFHKARVLTDVRPVFGDDKSQVSATVVLHTLKLTYWQGSSEETKDFYIALDGVDIGQLQDVLAEAKRKEDSLQAMLKPTQVLHLSERTREEGTE